MIKQNVNIVNFNTLYEILEEVKRYLSFNISKYDSEKNFLEKKKDKFDDSLIISNSRKNNLSKENLLVFSELPISLNEMIELINIELIKLKFNHQSNVNIKGYELDLNSKFFSKDSSDLKLTEKEIEIILYLNNKKIKHNIIDLQKNIWGYSSNLETHTVETHIYRFIKKINDKFNDNEFIKTHNDGYFIE
jgi:hypothetical protein